MQFTVYHQSRPHARAHRHTTRLTTANLDAIDAYCDAVRRERLKIEHRRYAWPHVRRAHSQQVPRVQLQLQARGDGPAMLERMAFFFACFCALSHMHTYLVRVALVAPSPFIAAANR